MYRIVVRIRCSQTNSDPHIIFLSIRLFPRQFSRKTTKFRIKSTDYPSKNLLFLSIVDL